MKKIKTTDYVLCKCNSCNNVFISLLEKNESSDRFETECIACEEFIEGYSFKLNSLDLHKYIYDFKNENKVKVDKT